MPKTMTPARLPEAMRAGGASVVVGLPLEEQSVAHRIRWENRQGRNARGSTVSDLLPWPACRANPDRRVTWGPFSAGWADHLGAHACPARVCFGATRVGTCGQCNGVVYDDEEFTMSPTPGLVEHVECPVVA